MYGNVHTSLCLNEQVTHQGEEEEGALVATTVGIPAGQARLSAQVTTTYRLHN